MIHATDKFEEVLADPEFPNEVERKYRDQYHSDRQPIANYSVDKGWVVALDHFAESIAANTTPENASALDALAASSLCHAAIRSRDHGSLLPAATEMCSTGVARPHGPQSPTR